MPYNATTVAGLDTTTPNGANEYGNILDDAIKEIKTVFKNQYAIATKTANYTLVAGDSVIQVNGTYTMTLPVASTVASSTHVKHYWIFNVGTGTVTIDRNGANINGAAANLTITAQYAGYHLWTDGTNWFANGINNQNLGAASATSLVLSGAINEAKGTDIASAATTDIGAATGNFVDVTGTTTITSLGTAQAGTRRIVRFTGALTLTHNATSLILPGNANITTAANDRAEFVSLGSGNWICTNYETTIKKIAFHANNNATTNTITASTHTKMNMQTEVFDTNSNYDTVNSKFTPTRAGKYLFNAQLTLTTANSSAGTQILCSIFKNGTATAGGQGRVLQQGGSSQSVQVSALLEANGTTDYFELYGYTVAGETVSGDLAQTYWTAFEV